MQINDLVDELKDKNVLIVEDGQDIRDIMSSIFSKLFHLTTTAVDGVDGLNKFKESKPDIVITDIRMPNMNGNEMIEKIRELDPNIPIIIVSGHGRMIKKNIQADLLMEKPINFDKLVRSIYELTTK